MDKIFVFIIGILLTCEIIASPVSNADPQPQFFLAIQRRNERDRLAAEAVERANVEARNAVERANAEARNEAAKRAAVEKELAKLRSARTTTRATGTTATTRAANGNGANGAAR